MDHFLGPRVGNGGCRQLELLPKEDLFPLNLLPVEMTSVTRFFHSSPDPVPTKTLWQWGDGVYVTPYKVRETWTPSTSVSVPYSNLKIHM